jgi:uncharacterized protein
MSKIAITGATGFIGSHLSQRLAEEGHSITVFTRNTSDAAKMFPSSFKIVEWDYHEPRNWEDEINENEIIIHLAGANLFARRWDDDYKKKIIESREVSSRNIVKAIRKDNTAVKVLISASGMGYYGDTNGIAVNEDSPAGTDFLAQICKKWEEPTYKADEKGIRRINMRMGLVLSTKEGYLGKLLPAYKLFVGGPLGKSSSWLSWIHIDDVLEAYLFAIRTESLREAVNVSSPNPVTARDFADTLGDVMSRPSFFTVPEAALKLLVGEAGRYIAYSQKVLPQELQECGFQFRYPELKPALEDLINNKK